MQCYQRPSNGDEQKNNKKGKWLENAPKWIQNVMQA